MKDFFREYHKHLRSSWIFSGIFALCLSVGIVTLLSSDTSLRLQADLSRASDTYYPADLILEPTLSGIVVTFGADAQAVDTVHMVVLADTDKIASLSSSHSGTTVVSTLSWVYMVNVDTSGRSLSRGDVITTLVSNPAKVHALSVTDTYFVSGSGVYNLSNIVR